MRSIITPRLLRDKKIMLILFCLLFSSVSFAQFSVSCTSKDLELVSARIGDANSCVSCNPNSIVTKDLILAINNKTGSFRPAFAYWGYLVQKDANGNPVGQPVLISDCSDDGLNANQITELTFTDELTYTCGNSLEIVNLVMAWTDAGKKSNCANLMLDPDKINPKCGTVPVVPVNAGLNVAGTPTSGTCSGGVPTKGSINVTTIGGITPYSFSWVGPSGFTANTEDISNLNAGLYTLTVTDNNSTPCQKTASFNITVPTGINASAVPTNGACVSGSPTNGSISLSVTTGTASSYEWTATSGGPIPNGQSDDQNLSNLPAGTYAVKVNSADGCYKNISSINVTVPLGINASAVPTNGTCGSNGVPTLGSINLTITLGTASTLLWTASGGGAVPSGKSADEDLSDLVAGTYAILATNAAGCYKFITGIAITVPTAPGAPAICKIEPALCGPATGTINVTAPLGASYSYSKNGGTNWQASPSFTNLAAGSSPGIMVKNGDGCFSAATICTSASVCAPPTKIGDQRVTEVDNINPLGSGELEALLSVRAMPNPFSNQVRFMIKTATSGMGSLDIYNLQGQKIKTVYSGYIRAGSSYFDLKFADHTNTSQLVYVLSINGEKVSGRLIRSTR
jgi:hypothetical protein